MTEARTHVQLLQDLLAVHRSDHRGLSEDIQDHSRRLADALEAGIDALSRRVEGQPGEQKSDGAGTEPRPNSDNVGRTPEWRENAFAGRPQDSSAAKPCYCGTDPCIGPAVLRGGYYCQQALKVGYHGTALSPAEGPQCGCCECRGIHCVQPHPGHWHGDEVTRGPQWLWKFFDDSGELLEFLSKLTPRQQELAKVLEGKKPGYAIYGWNVFYPEGHQ